MRGLRYHRPHHLGKLHDELVARVPGLAPVQGEARFFLSGDGQSVQLSIPDDVNPDAVAAVVLDHDPTPPPTPLEVHERGMERLKALYAQTQAASTQAQLKACLLDLEKLLYRYLAARAQNAADSDEAPA